MTARYRCAHCGELHDGPLFSYGADAPAYWYGLPEAERDARAELSDDLCVIDEEFFFIRARLLIPVHGGPHDFEWGVWVSLSEQNFRHAIERWNEPGREREAPSFGWLSTELPLYPSTLNLKSLVHTQPVGERPLVELEATDHPLAVEQREWITLQRVQDIAEQLLHSPAAQAD